MASNCSLMENVIEHEATKDSRGKLSLQDEVKIVEWIIEKHDNKLTLNWRWVSQHVKNYLEFHHRNIESFKNNIPKDDWCQLFLRKYPQLKTVLSKAKHIVPWFEELRSEIDPSLLSDPGRLYVCGVIELSLALHPDSPANSQTCATSLVAFSAHGHFIAPMVLLPESENGVDNTANKITAEKFEKWLVSVFIPSIEKKNLPLPILLLSSNLASLSSTEAVIVCRKADVILYHFPEVGNLIHPLDLGIYPMVKQQWDAEVKTHRMKTFDTMMTQQMFAASFSRVFRNVTTYSRARDSFHLSGIFPYDTFQPLKHIVSTLLHICDGRDDKDKIIVNSKPSGIKSIEEHLQSMEGKCEDDRKINYDAQDNERAKNMQQTRVKSQSQKKKKSSQILENSTEEVQEKSCPKKAKTLVREVRNKCGKRRKKISDKADDTSKYLENLGDKENCDTSFDIGHRNKSTMQINFTTSQQNISGAEGSMSNSLNLQEKKSHDSFPELDSKTKDRKCFSALQNKPVSLSPCLCTCKTKYSHSLSSVCPTSKLRILQSYTSPTTLAVYQQAYEENTHIEDDLLYASWRNAVHQIDVQNREAGSKPKRKKSVLTTLRKKSQKRDDVDKEVDSKSLFGDFQKFVQSFSGSDGAYELWEPNEMQMLLINSKKKSLDDTKSELIRYNRSRGMGNADSECSSYSGYRGVKKVNSTELFKIEKQDFDETLKEQEWYLDNSVLKSDQSVDEKAMLTYSSSSVSPKVEKSERLPLKMTIRNNKILKKSEQRSNKRKLEFNSSSERKQQENIKAEIQHGEDVKQERGEIIEPRCGDLGTEKRQKETNEDKQLEDIRKRGKKSDEESRVKSEAGRPVVERRLQRKTKQQARRLICELSRAEIEEEELESLLREEQLLNTDTTDM